MARIRPSWIPELTADAGLFAFGIDVEFDGAATVSGVWWYQPTGTVTDVTAFLYDQASQTVLATGTALAGDLTPDAWNLVDLAVPYVATASVTYTVAAEASGTHGYDNAVTLPVDAPDGFASIVQTRYQGGGGFPATDWGAGQHGVDVEYAQAGSPQGVTADFVSAAAAVFAPALTSVATIDTSLVGSSAVVHAPTLTSTATVAALSIASTTQVHAPTLTAGAVVEAGFIAPVSVAHPPIVTSGDDQVIFAPFIAGTTSVSKPRIYGGGRLAPLASVDDVEAILGRTLTAAEQTQASMFLEFASEYVRGYTGRTFEYQSNHLIRIQADAHGIIDLPDPPIHSVATVLDAEDDTEVDGWIWDQMWRLSCIPAWLTCKVTYTHGYVDVPAAITGIVASMSSRQLINPAGIRQETVGAISVTYASVFGEAGSLALSGMERQVLDGYRDLGRNWRI